MASPGGSDEAPNGQDPQPSGSNPNPSASSSSCSRDSNMAHKLQNAESLTIQLLQEITDNFSEMRKIGQGASGMVYKGVHDNGEEIAVKLLHNNIQGTDDEKFKREFENLMRLEHHNIVQLVGYCYETHHIPMMYNGETIYAEETSRALCFEYMRNGSLQMHISDECDGLDWHTRYKIIKGTCEGLKYLHEGFQEPIYHMDLKPDNILLDEDMTPKLADFGLSKLYDGEQTMITQSLMGTIGYLPPEYLFEHLVSKKLDIFSLGVVMTKIITGPRGPTRRAEMSYPEFMDQVYENWTKRLQESCLSSQPLEAYFEQVYICTEIALACMENDRHKRPNILDIIHKLNETENMIEELKTHWGHQWTRSDVPENPEGSETQFSQEPPAEDDPLPDIEGLSITGEAFPGTKLQVSGYSINGTTRCNFQWVRYWQDGSINYIEGARQTTYFVTADDIDSMLAIEVQPLDDWGRKGCISKVYANGERKITCDPEVKELIMQILSIGHVSYEVLLAFKSLDMWEPAILAIKRDGYSLKCNGPHGVVIIREKFQQDTDIKIPYGCPTEFSIHSADGAEYNLMPAENSPSRDAIVLIMRLFKMQTTERTRRVSFSFR